MTKIIFALIAMALVSCNKENPSGNTETDVLSKVKSAHLISASNKMTFQLLNHTDSLAAGHNIFISPLSVQQALSMTLNGAKEKTYDEMATALGFSNSDIKDINNYNHSLIRALVDADSKVTFQLANSIWALTGYPIEKSFFDVNQEYYDAEVNTEDFANPQTLININSWCENKMNGKVKEVLNYMDPNAMMYLINALYFKGTWKYEFDKKNTSQKTFYKANGEEILHDQMVMEATVDYYAGTDFSMVALPYGEGKFRMIVLLPAYEKNVESIVNSIDDGIWKQAVSELKPQKLQVKIPKFKFEFKSLMNNSLKRIGMREAFKSEANFTGISQPGGIYISRVIHQTFVEVNEEGSEAAAVTVVEMDFNSVSPGNDISVFNANQPFLYFIEEKSTGAVIFAGKMNDPLEEKFMIE